MRVPCCRTVTRRQALFAAAATLSAAGKKPSRLSLEGYIWQNYASREKKPLPELIDELFATAPYAGFQNIELNDGFFGPALKDRVVELTRLHKLSMPSVYVGGTMHEVEGADKTIARALEIGAICKEFGCDAVVHNPNTKAAQGRKTDGELAIQSESLNRMGRTLAQHGLQLRVHHHTAELVEDAREWRQILKNTDPKYVTLCLDLEHAQHGGMDPNAILREAGPRTTEVHLRNKKGETPGEAFADGDIDHHKIAATMKQLKLQPLIVIELAYHADTAITRPFKESLRLSRIYAEKVFAL
jgi:sugar phosphate isomerase/epimerase